MVLRFLNRNEEAKSTIALEYTYGRRNRGKVGYKFFRPVVWQHECVLREILWNLNSLSATWHSSYSETWKSSENIKKFLMLVVK